MEQLSSTASFSGHQLRFRHESEVLGCGMNFSLFLPEQASTQRVPLLTWLSGLTCTDENFVQKACAQRAAAEHGIAILAPDTSPRGEDVPDDPDGAWDFGLGAGFYLNALQEPWSRHYRMYDYVVDELPLLVASEAPVSLERQGIFGHSMGGHGAITIALKNLDRYRSVSAFAPICSPLNCPWGEKALGSYLGPDRSLWEEYDACSLIRRSRASLPLFVDQGSADNFLVEQLKTPLLEDACEEASFPATVRMHEGYDHSYFFIASFIDEHIAFHAQFLN
ncbi:MAG: S-formylglutathione hydrolase [Pseudomonadota bacterium]